MTLFTRNRLFKAGIVFSSVCMILAITATIIIIPVYPQMETEITRRSEGIFNGYLIESMDAHLLAVNAGILALVVYSLVTIALIYYFFEKTQSPEILFVLFFAASFSAEVFRLLIPLGRVVFITPLYSFMTSRIILFSRHFGIFSLFAASVFAVGYTTQQQRNILLFIITAALIIALGVPIDTQTWDSSLSMIIGYSSMLKLIEAGAFLITTVSFFVAAWLRGSREYVFIGTGSALAFLARNILVHTDTWAGLPVGIVLLALGTWLICTNLHKIYLWL